MKIFDRLRKHKDKSTENSSSHDLNSIVKDAAEKWEKIFSFLKGDLGNIWYPEELATFELLRNDIEKIKVLIERMRSFLEKNKINYPLMEKEINELLFLLGLIKDHNLRDFTVYNWFLEVNMDFKLLMQDLKSVERCDKELLSRVVEAKRQTATLNSNFRFISYPYKVGKIQIGHDWPNIIVTSYGKVVLREIPVNICNIQEIVSTSQLSYFSRDVEVTKDHIIVPKENIPESLHDSRFIKDRYCLNDGGRSIVLQSRYLVNLKIFGHRGVQEFRECRKGVGFVDDHYGLTPILPIPYMKMALSGNEGRPHGGQDFYYGVGEIETTNELLIHPEYRFKFCPTLYIIRIPPDFLEEGYKNYFSEAWRKKVPVNQKMLKNTAQEICLVPSTIRLGTFHPRSSYKNVSFLQSIASFPIDTDFLISQLMEDYVNYFNLVAQGVKKRDSGLTMIKIGDFIELYDELFRFPSLVQFFNTSAISKDIVIAQSGLYFKDLESLDLHYKVTESMDIIQLLRFQMGFLFYDVGCCLQIIIGMSERVKGSDSKLIEWYEDAPNLYFIRALIKLFRESPHLFIEKNLNNKLVLGIKTEVGNITFETHIDFMYVES